jgi:hypothetical protein
MVVMGIPNGDSMTYVYDVRNRLTRTRNPHNDSTVYGYNNLYLTSVRDPLGQMYNFGVNAASGKPTTCAISARRWWPYSPRRPDPSCMPTTSTGRSTPSATRPATSTWATTVTRPRDRSPASCRYCLSSCLPSYVVSGRLAEICVGCPLGGGSAERERPQERRSVSVPCRFRVGFCRGSPKFGVVEPNSRVSEKGRPIWKKIGRFPGKMRGKTPENRCAARITARLGRQGSNLQPAG